MKAFAILLFLAAWIYDAQCIPYCPGNHWTKFYDKQDPNPKGVFLTLKVLKSKYKEICAKPIEIDVRLLNGDYWYLGGNYIDEKHHKTPTYGFACLNAYQKAKYKPMCKHYKVRFCCLPEPPTCRKPGHWTPWFDVDDPTVTGDYETVETVRKQYPTVCTKPTAAHVVLTDHRHYLLGGDVVHKNDYGITCKIADQNDRKCNDYKVRFCCEYDEPKCRSPAYWTGWYDRDNPSMTGDWETFSDLRKENAPGLCAHPVGVRGRLKKGGRPWQVEAENVHLSKEKGLICENKKQKDKMCEDYEVSFCCKKECYYTGWFDRDDPTATGDWENLVNLRKIKNNNICAHPKKIEAVTVKGHIPAHKTGQVFTYYDVHKGFVCENKRQKYVKGYVYQPYQPPLCHDYKVRFYCC